MGGIGSTPPPPPPYEPGCPPARPCVHNRLLNPPPDPYICLDADPPNHNTTPTLHPYNLATASLASLATKSRPLTASGY